MPRDTDGNFVNRRICDVPPARPPGTLSELALEDLCTGCGDCALVCPQRAIEMDAMSFPRLVAPERCASCGLCADVCMHGAIELTLQTLIGLARCKAMDIARDKQALEQHSKTAMV